MKRFYNNTRGKQFLQLAGVVVVISVWIAACESASDGASPMGKGGSMARFTIYGERLYTVDNAALYVFDVSNTKNPVNVTSMVAGFEIETIFALNEMLFLGSRNGMYIYDLSSPDDPSLLSEYWHVYSCDPVVSDGDYAYVTLRSENNTCGQDRNELHVIDISDPTQPREVQVYDMENPKGLGIDGNMLFVCDEGLKVFDVTRKNDIRLISYFDNIDAYDVIPLNNVLLVIGNDGLFQYKYQNNSIQLISNLFP